MNTRFRHWLASTAAALILIGAAFSNESHSAEAAAPAAVAQPESAVDDASDDFPINEYRRHHAGNDIIAFGNHAILKSGEAAEEVVAIFGDATSDGTVAGAVVAIVGNTRATGPVGGEAVAILGNVYVNTTIASDVVAFLGNVELGPEARVGGDVVAIGGTLTRDPAAIVAGATQNMTLGPLASLEGLKVWIRHCLLLGRPLAVHAGLGWAWGIAAGFLAFYVLLGFLAGPAMRQCVTTLEQRPGRSLLAALIAIPAVPVVAVLLVMTIVGIVALPFLGAALFCAGFFGKAVMLAWIGRRITRPLAAMTNADATSADGPAVAKGDWSVPLAVLIGGAIVTALYLVPILGFVVYKLLGFIGLGVVLCTLLQSWQSSRADRVSTSATASAPAAALAYDDMPAPDAPASSSTMAAHAGMPRAGFWLRMAALALDLVLILVLTHLVASVFGHGAHSPGMPLLLIAVYGAVMWTLKGTTIGGSICGLQLVRVDGRPIDWGTAIMRALGCFLSLIVAGLGFIWIAFDKDQQAWHDKVAGTVVVRTPKGAPIV
jgi:uncharacterized RDD family membrane protein YckC